MNAAGEQELERGARRSQGVGLRPFTQMTSWAHRRERIDELLPELAQVLGAASHSPNELIHLALLEVAQLELHHQGEGHSRRLVKHYS